MKLSWFVCSIEYIYYRARKSFILTEVSSVNECGKWLKVMLVLLRTGPLMWSSHDRHIMVGMSDLIQHWLNHFFWYGLNSVSAFCLGHKSWQYSVSSRISRDSQIISVLLCDENVVYISSTATMNSSTSIVMRENALKLSVDEIVLIQRCWDTIWSFEFILKYNRLHENG